MTRSMLRARPSWSIAPSLPKGVTVMLKMPCRRARLSSMSFMERMPFGAMSGGGLVERAVDRAEHAVTPFGDDDGLAHPHGEAAIDPQRRRQMERHTGLELGLHPGVQAEDGAFAPVRREG